MENKFLKWLKHNDYFVIVIKQHQGFAFLDQSRFRLIDLIEQVFCHDSNII